MDKKYTIGMAAQLSGLTDLSIRTWENRYQVVSPERTTGNQRLYSDDDIKRLTILAKGVQKGIRISKLSKMTNEEIEESVIGKPEIPENNYINLALRALEDLDITLLEEIFESATIEKGVVQAMDEVILPFMNQLGEAWHKGDLSVYLEHLASETVKSFLSSKLQTYQNSKENPLALISTLSGQVHDLGAAASAVTAAVSGFHTLYLGSDIPSEELINIVKRSQASVLALSIVFPGNPGLIRRELEVIRKNTPGNCRLILGGSSARAFNQEQNLLESRNLNHLKEILLDVRNEITRGET